MIKTRVITKGRPSGTMQIKSAVSIEKSSMIDLSAASPIIKRELQIIMLSIKINDESFSKSSCSGECVLISATSL